MEKTTTTKAGPPLTLENVKAEKIKIAMHSATAFVRKLELAGKPETRRKDWKALRSGIMAGFVPGFDLGFEMATRLSALPTKEEAEKLQMELFNESDTSIPS